jgi:hypothetical protein
MTRRAVAALGVGQCVNWGVLYYAFTVLLLPLEAHLRAPRWVITGAFSTALLISAACAPLVGRASDRGNAAAILQSGGFAATGLLLFWAAVPGVFTLYVAWAGLGICMAATLYEPAFALIVRAQGDDAERLRALATVTVFGGLASTVFLPATGVLVAALGWRGAVVALALILAVSTLVTGRIADRNLRQVAPQVKFRENTTGAHGRGFSMVVAVFCLASMASAALTTNLVPALAERDVTPATAAMLGSLVGVMQLPGRALLMRGPALPAARLLLVGTAIQSAGLMVFAAAGSAAALAGAIAVFAVGAGLMTLVRPHLVHTVFSEGNAGALNGQVARWQQLARGAGPVSAAWLARDTGYAAIFGALGCVLIAVAVITVRAVSRTLASIATSERHDGRKDCHSITRT